MATSGGAGKDTAADYIVNELSGGSFVKHALGAPIHEIADRYCSGKVERHHLQDLGEQMRRIFGEDVWIRDVDRFIAESEKSVVIPDVRKLIEFAHFRAEKGYNPLYIKANEDVAKERLTKRDGGFNQEDLNRRSIEGQMRFIEALPTESVDNTGLMRVVNTPPFDGVYIADNSSSLDNFKTQLKQWWELIND